MSQSIRAVIGAILIWLLLGSTQWWIPKLQAESLHRRLKPAMSWADLTQALQSKPKWSILFFDGDPKVCGWVSNHKGNLELALPGAKIRYVKLQDMNDPAILEQAANCHRLRLQFQFGFPKALLDVGLKGDRSVAAISDIRFVD